MESWVIKEAVQVRFSMTALDVFQKQLGGQDLYRAANSVGAYAEQLGDLRLTRFGPRLPTRQAI